VNLITENKIIHLLSIVLFLYCEINKTKMPHCKIEGHCTKDVATNGKQQTVARPQQKQQTRRVSEKGSKEMVLLSFALPLSPFPLLLLLLTFFVLTVNSHILQTRRTTYRKRFAPFVAAHCV